DRRDKTADDITIGVYAQRQEPARTSAPFKGRVTSKSGVVAGGRSALEGVVKDTSGNPVAGAGLIAERITNGKATPGYTDVQGRFSITNLAPGNYRVRLEREGFRSTFYRTLSLEAGELGMIEATLEPRGIVPVTLAVYPAYDHLARDGEVAFRKAGRMEMRERAQNINGG